MVVHYCAMGLIVCRSYELENIIHMHDEFPNIYYGVVCVCNPKGNLTSEGSENRRAQDRCT